MSAALRSCCGVAFIIARECGWNVTKVKGRRVIRDYERMIHSLCYRMSGSLADAEDLAQETMIHAHQHLDGFPAEAHLSSWLYRIAVNQCLNWQERGHRLDQLHLEWGEQGREPMLVRPNKSRRHS